MFIICVVLTSKCDLFEFVETQAPHITAYCGSPNVQCFYLICNFCNFFSYVSVNSLVLSHWANSDAHDLCFSEFIFATRDAKLKIMAMPPEISDEQHILPHLHLKVQCYQAHNQFRAQNFLPVSTLCNELLQIKRCIKIDYLWPFLHTHTFMNVHTCRFSDSVTHKCVNTNTHTQIRT